MNHKTTSNAFLFLFIFFPCIVVLTILAFMKYEDAFVNVQLYITFILVIFGTIGVLTSILIKELYQSLCIHISIFQLASGLFLFLHAILFSNPIQYELVNEQFVITKTPAYYDFYIEGYTPSYIDTSVRFDSENPLLLYLAYRTDIFNSPSGKTLCVKSDLMENYARVLPLDYLVKNINSKLE
jgi:hypothetical protein